MAKNLSKIIERDLDIKHVEILSAVQDLTVKMPYFYCRCIDSTESDEQQQEIASTPNPEAARKAYRFEPKEFFAQVQCLGGLGKATRLTADEINKVIKRLGSEKHLRPVPESEF